MARLRGALVAVIGTVLVLAGCGEEPQEASQPPEAPVVSTPADDAATGTSAPGDAPVEKPAKKPVPEELKFTAKTVDGKKFAGKSVAGKPVVLWFWTPWCSDCQAEAPTVAELASSGRVNFVGVAAQDEVSAMQGFVDRYGLGSFPHIADTDGEVWKRFGVTQQPAFAFVGSRGGVNVVKDILDDQELRDQVGALR